MKRQLITGIFICSAAVLLGQTPAAPPPSTVGSATATGSIEQFNYGPDGRVQGLLIAPNTLVSLPPDWAMQVEMLAKPGDRVTATGAAMPTASGMQVLNADSINVAGKTLSAAQVSQPAPYAGSGVIRSLNYGPGGEVNGFVLQNGIVALTPPMGTSDVSVVKRGANISLSGFARVTASGRTVVEVQSITANGQTIAMNAAMPGGPGPGGPGPGRGPGRGRGPVGAAPPPPPPPPGR